MFARRNQLLSLISFSLSSSFSYTLTQRTRAPLRSSHLRTRLHRRILFLAFTTTESIFAHLIDGARQTAHYRTSLLSGLFTSRSSTRRSVTNTPDATVLFRSFFVFLCLFFTFSSHLSYTTSQRRRRSREFTSSLNLIFIFLALDSTETANSGMLLYTRRRITLFGSSSHCGLNYDLSRLFNNRLIMELSNRDILDTLFVLTSQVAIHSFGIKIGQTLPAKYSRIRFFHYRLAYSTIQICPL